MFVVNNIFLISQALLTVDFEIGHYIRERIVPRAVLFFTGEALDEESDYDEEEEEDEDDEDGSGSENDADFDPKAQGANPECKQQWILIWWNFLWHLQQYLNLINSNIICMNISTIDCAVSRQNLISVWPIMYHNQVVWIF